MDVTRGHTKCAPTAAAIAFQFFWKPYTSLY